MIQGLVQLFIFQALGELLSKFALPFIPGPVLGLVLLLAFLRLRGHVPASMDMVGSGIFDGDILVVDRAVKPRHNHIVVAVVDGEFTVKQLYQRHRELDKKVTDAELGVLPIDDTLLGQMKREKLHAKERLLRIYDAKPH